MRVSRSLLVQLLFMLCTAVHCIRDDTGKRRAQADAYSLRWPKQEPWQQLNIWFTPQPEEAEPPAPAAKRVAIGERRPKQTAGDRRQSTPDSSDELRLQKALVAWLSMVPANGDRIRLPIAAFAAWRAANDEAAKRGRPREQITFLEQQRLRSREAQVAAFLALVDYLEKCNICLWRALKNPQPAQPGVDEPFFEIDRKLYLVLYSGRRLRGAIFQTNRFNNLRSGQTANREQFWTHCPNECSIRC